MDNPGIVVLATHDHDHDRELHLSHIGKGKRTKRIRPQSPISFAMPSCSSTEVPDPDLDVDYHGGSGYDSDDQNMANCLILLARSCPRKFCERNYVYECKTCGRNFSSFQALGGHRASHKKPKSGMAMELKTNNVSSSISLQLSSSVKVHECSVCGAEFSSGQALGGHMRRHRAVPVNMSTAALTLTAPIMLAAERPKETKSVICLDLNLNLPVVPEEDCREQKTQHPSPPVVFPATTLVDCLN